MYLYCNMRCCYNFRSCVVRDSVCILLYKTLLQSSMCIRVRMVQCAELMVMLFTTCPVLY